MVEIEELRTPCLTRAQSRVLTPLYKDFELICAEGPRFGNMLKCTSLSTHEVVAIKILNIPENQKIYGVPHRILRHVSILKMLSAHPNIVRLLKVMETEDDVFLVFEYFEINLKRYMAANFLLFDIRGQEKALLRGALTGLAYCHSHKIIHRDLKPNNILVSFTGFLDVNQVKLCDFGVAKIIEPPLSPYSNNMGIPCYKAPEVLMGSVRYSSAVDIWSMGCIFAEMIKLKPLFVGRDDAEILIQIFGLFGAPKEEIVPGAYSICTSLDPSIMPKDFTQEFPKFDPVGLDLLSKMLCLCPSRRISADEALKHPYLNV